MTPITAVSAIGGEFPQRNAQGLSIVDYVKGTEEAALHLGCPIIDVHQCGISLHNSSNTLVDTVHPNINGDKLIGRKVVGGLKEMSPIL